MIRLRLKPKLQPADAETPPEPPQHVILGEGDGFYVDGIVHTFESIDMVELFDIGWAVARGRRATAGGPVDIVGLRLKDVEGCGLALDWPLPLDAWEEVIRELSGKQVQIARVVPPPPAL